jgi:hypothetical protein
VAAARAAWRAEAAGIDPERLIFIDESGFDTRLTRTHARAPRGQRAHGTAPGGHWRRLTLIGALGLDGICAAMTVAAATGTAVFLAFVTQVLIPVLSREKPDAVVVMGNLAAHKAAGVRHALEAAGSRGRLPLPARLLAGQEPPRASLVEAENPPARQGRPLPRGARERHPRRPRNHHPQRRPKLVPPRGLCAKLTRNPL